MTRPALPSVWLMSEDALTVLSRFSEYLRQQADRPFGNVESVSGRTLQPFSQALSTSARNLLTKARRALTSGDRSRAVAYVDRAVALPYDQHEDVRPAAREAHMQLFMAVTDALEASAVDDSRWLDAALEVMSFADDRARFVLRDVLDAVAGDYQIERVEHHRLRAGIADVPARVGLEDLDLSSEQLCEHVVAVLDACNAYEAALTRHAVV